MLGRTLTTHLFRMSEIIETKQLAEQLKDSLTLKGNDKTQVNDGAVVVKTGGGKTKVRKGQTEEAYQIQKKQFESSGPVINTETWLEELKLDVIKPELKSDRALIEHLAQRLYFKRDYSKCLEVSTKALDLFKDLNWKKIKNEIDELEYLQTKCLKKLEEEATNTS